MKTESRARLAASLLCLLAWGVALSPRALSIEVKIKINPVGEENVLEGGVLPLYLDLEAKPAQPFIVKVQCGVTTRYFIIDPNDPWTGGGGRYCILDDQILVGKGKQELTVTALSPDEATTYAEATLSFTAVDCSDKTKSYWLGLARLGIQLPGKDLWEQEVAYRSLHRTLGTEEFNAESFREAELDFMAAATSDFISRITAHSDLAYAYDRFFQPGDALRALEHAEMIYEEEKGRKFDGTHHSEWPITRDPQRCVPAPGHFEACAAFYMRRGALGRAIDSLEKQAQWYLDQAEAQKDNAYAEREALRYAADAYRKIALNCFMLEKDHANYDKWLDVYKKTLPEDRSGISYASPRPVRGVY